MALDTALGASHALTSDAPEQALALVAVRRRRRRPRDEIVRRRAADRVDQRLERLFVHVHFLFRNIKCLVKYVKTPFLAAAAVRVRVSGDGRFAILG